MTNRNLTIGLVVVAIVAIIGLFTPQGKAVFGAVTGVTNFNKLGISELKIGSACNDSFGYSGCVGTAITNIKTGSCTIWAGATTIAATSSAQIVCQGATNGGISAISGIQTTSVCNLLEASSTSTTLAGLVVTGASASSTAGSIVANLANFTGTTFTWTATASSSSQWNYVCLN